MRTQSRRARCIAAVLAPLLWWCGSGGAEDSVIVDAVWKPQRITFEYHGYGTYYTCYGLKQRLHSVLTRLGAHENLVIREIACDEAMRWARVEIAFLTPVEATRENIDALTSYTTEQLMVARLRGLVLPSAQDLTRFRAEYEEISFARDRALGLTGADCELVQQIRKKIFPTMAVRVVAKGVLCLESGSLRPPGLKVVALVPTSR